MQLSSLRAKRSNPVERRSSGLLRRFAPRNDDKVSFSHRERPPSPRTRGEGRDERLSLRSSDFWLPWTLISQDGVEDGEELSGYGNQCDELGLAGCNELVAEWLEDWIVMAGDHRGHEQDVADAFAAAADEALASPLTGLAGPGRKANQSGDLAAIEGAELRQFGDQGAGNNRPDAGNGREQVLLLGPDRRATHMIVDLAIEFGELFFHRLTQPRDALPQTLVGHPPRALPLGSHHLDNLAPPRNQISQKPGHLVRQRTRLYLGGFDKMSNDGGVDRIRLRSLAEGLGEGAHLRRIDHHDRQVSRYQASGNNRLKTPRSLNPDDARSKSRQPFSQSLDPGALRSTTKLSPLGRTQISNRSLATS